MGPMWPMWSPARAAPPEPAPEERSQSSAAEVKGKSVVRSAAEAQKADRGGAATLAVQAPWIVAFAFGLLHGLGFAGALAQIGLPAGSIPLSLLCFNIGVEIGQLLFVVALLSGAYLFTRLAGRGRPSAYARTAALTVIGPVASYWLLVRVSDLLA